MAISQEVFATALQEQMKGLSETFMLWHPLLEAIVTRGNISKSTLEGPFRDFVLVQGGPGAVDTIYGGSEVISGGRTQQGVRGNTFAGRMIYSFDVPLKDLAYANGKQDLARILQNYPEMAVGDFHERISDQLATGTGAGVGAYPTLFGGTTIGAAAGVSTSTFNPEGTARSGFLLTEPIAAQMATVHNVNSSGGATGIVGWHNQYGQIAGGFSVSGRAVIRRAYYAASRQGKTLGDVDVLFADELTYLNLLEDLDDFVRVDSVKEGDHVPSKLREGIKYLSGTMYLESSIDTAAATLAATPAADGLVYGLKTPTWHAYNVGHGGEATKGNFEVRGPFRLPEQDMMRTEIVLHQGLYTNNRRANFTVTGGAIP
jgi:hypothetical protein